LQEKDLQDFNESLAKTTPLDFLEPHAPAAHVVMYSCGFSKKKAVIAGCPVIKV